MRRDISKTNCREGDHAEVQGVEQGQVIACSFQVLDTADADQSQFGNMENEEENKEEKQYQKGKKSPKCVFEVSQEAI